MPTEVWVALIGVIGIVVGYFLRPLGELSGEIVRERRATNQRRGQFQFETLIAISESLEKWSSAGATLTSGGGAAMERIRVLAFRVQDDALRGLLERFTASNGVTDHDRVLARLGEVLRGL